MAVYVDDAKIQYGCMKMCHMIADNTIELIAMAEQIGVKSKWIQKSGTPYEHFDICDSKRKLAIKYGAKTVSTKDIVLMMIQRKKISGEINELDRASIVTD
jgi:Protein of unknown function (DUF4031)